MQAITTYLPFLSASVFAAAAGGLGIDWRGVTGDVRLGVELVELSQDCSKGFCSFVAAEPFRLC
jgi:hypothetical protein